MGLLLLALGAAAQAPATEYTYQVTASIVLPGHGFHGYDMDVRLSTMPADWHATLPGAPKAAARAVRLDVDRVRHYDDKGGDMSEPALGSHPFYYFLSDSGHVAGVAHHEDDDEDAVGSKRAMAATHQLPLAAREAVEEDAVGVADAVYAVAGGAGFLRPRRVVHKQLRFREGPAVPRGFEYTINSTTVLEADGTPRSVRQLSHFEARPERLAVGGAHAIQHEGFEFLPREPRVVEWKLTGSRPLPACGLPRAPAQFVPCSLRFASRPPPPPPE